MYASIAEIPAPSCIAGIPSKAWFGPLQSIPVITSVTPQPVKGNRPRFNAFNKPADPEGLVVTMGDIGRITS